ncbi:MAG TPA: GNAT family N-acetyltransferase, partial [Gammaproteobacteria bacterium]|nr:GNAT family N-acetyltransferase [Gammaproteobacteria bacterium]
MTVTGNYQIRSAKPEEYAALGKMIVDVYAALPGMPTPQEQPDYYNKLLDVAARAANPEISVYATISEAGELFGSVDFIHDMTHYGSGGTAGAVPNAAGIRLLAVNPATRGMGIGKALTQFCIDEARR